MRLKTKNKQIPTRIFKQKRNQKSRYQNNFTNEKSDYFKVKTATTGIEGHWLALSVLGELLSEEELALVDDYKEVMSSEVAGNYIGFVSDFKKDGYFAEGKEPLTWME